MKHQPGVFLRALLLVKISDHPDMTSAVYSGHIKIYETPARGICASQGTFSS